MDRLRIWRQLSRWTPILCAAILVTCAAVVGAQGSIGTLTSGQPSTGQIATAGETLRFDYTLAQTSQVTLQALSDSVPPKLAILQNGQVVAAEDNASGALTISLNTLLQAGSYVVEVSAANNTTGLVILVVQSETPLNTTMLTAGQHINASVSASEPMMLYRFDALTEPVYVYIDSPDGGVNVRFGDGVTGKQIAESGAEVLGARYRFGAGSQNYIVEIGSDSANQTASFSLCFSAVSANGCEAGNVDAPTQAPVIPVAPTAQASACTVTPNVTGGVNIRQSATTNSIILGSLPGNASADVLGISPQGSFYNILYSGINGWVALSVVNNNGNCATVSVVNPPAVVAPTALPTQAAPTASGPCLISINSPTFVYTTTIADMNYLFDQVQGGSQLIPLGRLADNSWWQTNNYGAWIPTNVFGSTASISGNCSTLPIVAAPYFRERGGALCAPAALDVLELVGVADGADCLNLTVCDLDKDDDKWLARAANDQRGFTVDFLNLRAGVRR